jgi:hypothetical protein
MANTYIAISTSTVGSGGATTIEFANIPSTYTDLKLVGSWRVDRAGQTRSGSRLWFNSNTSAWASIRLAGYDSNSVLSDAGGSTYFNQPQPTASSATANTFGSVEFYIPNYAGSQSKTLYSMSGTENNSTTAWILEFDGGLWDSASAITNIKIDGNGYDFVQYSTFTLYGIANA